MGRNLVVSFGFLASLLLTSAPALAASVTLSRASRPVTAAEIAAGAPASGYVHDFFVTSSSDILSINRVEITAPLFQHTLGSDVSTSTAQMLQLSDALSADSFITLPGQTSSVGGGFDQSPGEHVWFDVSNDGSQEDFHFARLTTTGQSGEFSGRVSVRDYDFYVSLPFRFSLPGTESELALLADEPTFTLQYSLDPPPVLPVPPSVPGPVPHQPPVSQPELPAPQPEPQVPPATSEPPFLEQPPFVEPVVEAPYVELPPIDVPYFYIDVPVETVTLPAIESLVGEWVGSVERFPVFWDPSVQTGDRVPLVTADDPSEIFVVTNWDGAELLWARPGPLDDWLADGSLLRYGFVTEALKRISSVDTTLVAFSSAAAREAFLPEPTTAGLAVILIPVALAARRRRPPL